jgi:4-hydroxy-tetrahydrodipicolinate synthase
MTSIHGIVPPIITPMQANEDLDLPKLRCFLDHQMNAGVHVLFVLGTNSEAYALEEREKQAVIATAVEHVAQRKPVLAGTGAPTTRETIRLTKLAEKEGVDAVSVITPYFIAPSQQEMLDHYRRVAEATSLPVMLYNNPSHTGGVKLAPETVAQLAEVPNIVAIKDSSGDLQNTLDYLRLVPKSFAVLQGRDTLIWPSLLFGCAGAVPASANVAPHLCVAIYEAFRRGDQEAAKAAQLRLNPVRLSLMLATPPAGPKAALRLLGMDMGPCRAPLRPLSAEKEKQMRQALVEAGLLTNTTASTR